MVGIQCCQPFCLTVLVAPFYLLTSWYYSSQNISVSFHESVIFDQTRDTMVADSHSVPASFSVMFTRIVSFVIFWHAAAVLMLKICLI